MRKHEAYECYILKRRLQYLELSDEFRVPRYPDDNVSRGFTDVEFSDLNTLELLIEHLTKLKALLDKDT